MNHLPYSPAEGIELPKQPKTLPKAILTEEEVERILAQPNTTTMLGLRDRAIFETLYSTGIRRAELCGLRIDDVQVERQSLFVCQGKGRKDRDVPIGLRGGWPGSPATWSMRGAVKARSASERIWHGHD